MNRYEVKISGQANPIQVRASKASVALARAVNRLTDSNFLNTAIVIRFKGKVPRVFHVQAVQLADRSRPKLVAHNLPTKEAAQSELAAIRAAHPEYIHLFITSSLAEAQ